MSLPLAVSKVGNAAEHAAAIVPGDLRGIFVGPGSAGKTWPTWPKPWLFQMGLVTK